MRSLILVVAIAFTGCSRSDKSSVTDTGGAGAARPGQTRWVRSADVGGAPVYPRLELGGQADAQELEDGTLAFPAIVGKTYDPMEKVVAFYAENLVGWNAGEFHDVRFFWKGEVEGGYSPLRREAMLTPSVTISPPLRDGDWVSVQHVFAP